MQPIALQEQPPLRYWKCLPICSDIGQGPGLSVRTKRRCAHSIQSWSDMGHELNQDRKPNSERMVLQKTTLMTLVQGPYAGLEPIAHTPFQLRTPMSSMPARVQSAAVEDAYRQAGDVQVRDAQGQRIAMLQTHQFTRPNTTSATMGTFHGWSLADAGTLTLSRLFMYSTSGRHMGDAAATLRRIPPMAFPYDSSFIATADALC
ncbi:hypothetical protein CERZMDRAFT_95068 [Cercospora zeae-maydis SCOH1-5]|uniref:Uncharacterized protein n=1 Tax=Cercospora zeae-maydis SCOH1-5 TaxID=717836 RepID=A0A6A6FMG4_9PEZI|nr:hypothetical protein CERZMDRAFT_95068 [Cercospora zeae-maydis SCOH1-5]